MCWCRCPEIGTSSIDLAQMSRFYLKTETKSSLRCVVKKKIGRWIMSRNIIFVFVLATLSGVRSRDGAVGISTGNGLDDRGVGVRVPVGSRIFSSPCRPDWLWGQPNLLMGTGGSFPIRLHGAVLNSLCTGTNLPLSYLSQECVSTADVSQ
jgi:hypothetical protein